MSQLNQSKNDIQPDTIYFDLQTTNFASTTTEPPPFYFNEQRTNPYLLNPDDYYLSIIRFTVDSGTLPVFIPSIQPNQADRDLTIYSVSMTYKVGGVNFESTNFVKWSPQDVSAKEPPPPSETTSKVQDNSTGYYNCYSYQYFCFRVYTALQECLADLQALVEGDGEIFPATVAPILNWDSSSSRGVFYADINAFDLSLLDNLPPVEPIRVFMNAPLYALFSSFPARYFGYDAPNGKSFLLLIANVGATNNQQIVPNNVTADQYTAITVFQEWSTTASWTPITALVFTSNTLPINASQVSQPVNFRDGQITVFGTGGNSAVANIITDIVSDSGLYAPNLVYLPQAQYRLIQLFGNQPLYNLDVSIFYRLKTGELVPFRLQSGGSVSMKLAFLKKTSIVNK